MEIIPVSRFISSSYKCRRKLQLKHFRCKTHNRSRTKHTVGTFCINHTIYNAFSHVIMQLRYFYCLQNNLLHWWFLKHPIKYYLRNCYMTTKYRKYMKTLQSNLEENKSLTSDLTGLNLTLKANGLTFQKFFFH